MTVAHGPSGAAIVDHEFTPIANPRRPDQCARCHFSRDRHVQLDRERDIPDEKRIAGVVAMATTDHGLFEFAQHRAHDTAVRDWDDRDFTLEIAEELADAANYALWDAQREEQGDRWVADLQFLVKLCEAWAALQYRRSLG